jgi:hydroxymethylpyrimidine pyrophosphatase-like HAD family hydrolase
VRPVHLLNPDEARALRGVLFDLDDTVLTAGVLTRASYDALWDLHDAGLALVAVTGRPSSWGLLLTRQWPLAGCVTENGALHVVRSGADVILRDPCDGAERGARRARLAQLVERVGRRVPEARLADDNEGRRSDVAWDIAERTQLPREQVLAIRSEIEAAGARPMQSSVHLHASFDVDDKASGALAFCARELQCDPASALVRFAFVGDSANDAACFGAFRTTFGVANVRAHLGALTVPPRYVSTETMGAGFAEIARELLTKRRAST